MYTDTVWEMDFSPLNMIGSQLQKSMEFCVNQVKEGTEDQDWLQNLSNLMGLVSSFQQTTEEAVPSDYLKKVLTEVIQTYETNTCYLWEVIENEQSQIQQHQANLLEMEEKM